MFLMLPCPTILDNVIFIAQGQLKNKIVENNESRKILRQLSDTGKLIQRVQNGEIIIQHKIKLDSYIKSQIQMLKHCQSTHTNCQFKYNGFGTTKNIDTTLMLIAQQWGFEIIMSRYILSSVYIGGAIQSIGQLFQQTTNSYMNQYKNTPEFTKNLQITYKYFKQAIDPLNRLYNVIDDMQLLFNKNTLQSYAQINSKFFKFFTQLIQTNLAYVKIQKYRVLCEYKSCKQASWAVYQRFKQLKIKLSNNLSSFQIIQQIKNYINLGIVFYKSYALYGLLQQNEHKKIQQEYGFIKKQFQDMINQNIVIAEEIINLKNMALKLPGQELDNVMFANMVLEKMSQYAQRIIYRYNIQIHQTKMQKPLINTITAQINSKNIWDLLTTF